MRIFSYGLAEMSEARMPVRFWIDGSEPEYRGHTLGIAPRHFIISSPVELLDGMRLMVKVRIALDPSAQEFSELELFGWVVSASELANGAFGCQVELEHS